MGRSNSAGSVQQPQASIAPVTAPAAQPGQNVFNQSANAYTAALQGTQGAMNYQPQSVGTQFGYQPMAVGAQNVNTQFGYNPAQVQAGTVGTQFGYNPAQVQAGTVGTQFGYDPAQVQAQTAAGGMAAYQNPYTQQVIDQSMSDLDRQRQMQQRTTGAQATAAGAFGGSRHGIAEAETNRAYAEKGGQLAGQLRAQGFNTALGAAQQDVTRQLQADTSNQAAQAMAAQFGQQTGLQGQMANQSAGLQANIANQTAGGQAAQFGQQTGLQGQIANLNAGLQAGIANQSALGRANEFGQQTGLTAQGMNQNAGLQAGIANQNAFGRATEFGQQMGLQGQIANQNAGLQGAQFRLGAGAQMGNLSNLGFGYGTQLANYQNQMGAQQQLMMQNLINASRGQYGGFTGAPNAALGLYGQALGATPGGQGTQTTTSNPGTMGYLSAGAGLLGAFCWVAREVYGPEDSRWTEFRHWLLTDAPTWLLKAYAKHGEAFAGVVRRVPILKRVLRPLMDRARRAAGFEG